MTAERLQEPGTQETAKRIRHLTTAIRELPGKLLQSVSTREVGLTWSERLGDQRRLLLVAATPAVRAAEDL